MTELEHEVRGTPCCRNIVTFLHHYLTETAGYTESLGCCAIFKVATTTHNIFHEHSPPYLKDVVTFSVSGPQRRQHQSSAARSAVVLRTRTHFGRRVFSVCGLDIWNSLPLNISLTDSHAAFRRACMFNQIVNKPEGTLPTLSATHCKRTVCHWSSPICQQTAAHICRLTDCVWMIFYLSGRVIQPSSCHIAINWLIGVHVCMYVARPIDGSSGSDLDD